MEALKNAILGKESKRIFESYKQTKKWDKMNTSEDNSGVYSSFIKKLELLGSKDYKNKSTLILRTDKQTGGALPSGDLGALPSGDLGALPSGDLGALPSGALGAIIPGAPIPGAPTTGANLPKINTKIPIDIPSTYIWEKVQAYVEEKLDKDISKKISSNPGISSNIKTAFEETFLKMNCDCLDISPDNKKMTEYVNTEYSKILDGICKTIPKRYAASILQRYIERNFDTFVYFLNTTVFKEGIVPKMFETFFFQHSNVPSSLLKNKDVLPIHPTIVIQKNDSGQPNSNSLCKVSDGVNMDTTGLSDYLKSENIKENSGINAYKPAIIKPVFNIMKEQFTQSTENEEFLKNLFNMYSQKCIQFIKQIQSQFDNAANDTANDTANDKVSDFIERFILTKHEYTTKLISECIKHVSDIKTTLVAKIENNAEMPAEQKLSKKSDLNVLLSQYAAVLMSISSDTKPLKLESSNEENSGARVI
jgi:hypothetical protein